MMQPQALFVRTFGDRTDGLAHFFQRAGEAPRLLAYDDQVGCPMDTALAAIEWTGAVGIIRDDDLIHAARLTTDTSVAVIERRDDTGRRFLYFGPSVEAASPVDGQVFVDEPGLVGIEFSQKAHALAHFLRATEGSGSILSFLSRRAPEVRHLRRWLGAILSELDHPRLMVAGWFAASRAGCLFLPVASEEDGYRYIETGLES